jgi:hypothetical protein
LFIVLAPSKHAPVTLCDTFNVGFFRVDTALYLYRALTALRYLQV